LIVLDLADAGDHAAVELNHDELKELKGQFEQFRVLLRTI
jgi:hypothetical protein